jgi:hypothetical protein
MSDEIKKPEDKPGEESDVDLSKTRTAIMMKLAPAMDKVMLDAGFSFDDPDIRRRYFRAMIHLAMKKMLDIGVHPQQMFEQMVEALGHELEERGVIPKNGLPPPPSKPPSNSGMLN